MNFLAHLYLSGADPAIMAGNFMGDFIKGRIEYGYPAGLKDGIILHRKIDSFVQRHELFCRSRRRIAVQYGLYRGVILDLFYDHFLITDWERYSTEDLGSFLVRARCNVERFRTWMPARLMDLTPVIFDQLLPSYATVEGVGAALRRMACRIPRENPLPGSEKELVRHHSALRDDFRQFLPILNAYAAEVRSALRQAVEQD